MDRLTDEELMERYKRGDPRAFEILFVRHRAALYGFLCHLSSSRAAADDLLQETFARVISAAPRYEPTAKFRTWLFSIARNQCIDFFRRRKVRGDDRSPHKLGDADGAQEEHELESEADAGARSLGAAALAEVRTAEVRLALKRALARLPEEQREVFLLRQVYGMPFEEVAEVTAVPENTLKSRMRYALEKLRQELSPSEESRP